MRVFVIAVACLLVVLSSCTNADKQAAEKKSNPLFTLLSPDSTHITFSNTLKEGPNTNVLMYEYFYNGGGVAIGDLKWRQPGGYLFYRQT